MTSVLRYGWIKREAGHKFHFPETRFGSVETSQKQAKKQNAPVRKPEPMRLEEVTF
jgi:hypothetical protein